MEILDWPPFVWAARIGLLVIFILFLGGAWAVFLYLARYFRLSHVRVLLGAKLPTFRTVGGSAELFGQKLALNATIDEVRDDQLLAIVQRMADLEERQRGMAESVDRLIHEVQHGRKRQLAEGSGGPGEGEQQLGTDGAAEKGIRRSGTEEAGS